MLAVFSHSPISHTHILCKTSPAPQDSVGVAAIETAVQFSCSEKSKTVADAIVKN